MLSRKMWGKLHRFYGKAMKLKANKNLRPGVRPFLLSSYIHILYPSEGLQRALVNAFKEVLSHHGILKGDLKLS